MNEKIMNLNWIGTNKHGHKATVDVSISISSSDAKRSFVGFIFRNESWKFFTDTDFFVVAPYKNRLFFKAADKSNGIYLCKNNNTKTPTRYGRIQRDFINTSFAEYVGDYELKHDDFYDLYYIERNDKQ